MPRRKCFLMQLSFRDEGHEKPQDLTVEGSTQVELLSDASSVDSASKSIMSIPSHVLGDVMQTPSWTVAAGSQSAKGPKKVYCRRVSFLKIVPPVFCLGT